jgi:hypothetical protein
LEAFLEISMTARIEFTTGQRFGRLTVVRCDGTKDGQILWRCSCDCGCETVIRASSLKSGNTKSCGCLNRESNAARAAHPGSRPLIFDPVRRGPG